MIRIRLPRAALLATVGLFSLYHVVLAVYSVGLGLPRDDRVIAFALVGYLAALGLLLVPGPGRSIPLLPAVGASVLAIVVLGSASSVIDPPNDGANGYATWYVGAVCTLMTILAARGWPALAWLGLGVLAAHTVWWAGGIAIVSLGVAGGVVWVAVAQLIVGALHRAARDAAVFASAERQAAQWQAEQEAHLVERQLRLDRTARTAGPMLTTIREQDGKLTSPQRAEARILEAAIRDEIRGRALLDDRVRSAVMAARRRGVEVAVLDDGGLDELDERARERVLAEVACAIDSADANRIVVRTAAEGSTAAVTVVGVRGSETGDSDDGDVGLWVEIPRR